MEQFISELNALKIGVAVPISMLIFAISFFAFSARAMFFMLGVVFSVFALFVEYRQQTLFSTWSDYVTIISIVVCFLIVLGELRKKLG